jgi:hypothetical protein
MPNSAYIKELHTYIKDMPTEEATTRVANRGHSHKGDYVGEEEHTLENCDMFLFCSMRKI